MSQDTNQDWISEPLFFGDGYDKQLDFTRLKGNLKKVHDVMIQRMNERRVITLRKLSELTGVPEASASACLRTMRNQGGFVIEKKRSEHNPGVWVYWIAGGGMGKHSRKPKKLKPIGDAKLFGKMMQAIYVMANTPDEEMRGNPEHPAPIALWNTTGAWALDMAKRVRQAKEAS